ncbi:MAG: 30S ribosomal protein S20 [Candidatus Woesebacteria bacterium GW2011_GWC2_40_30]|nr:MAG: 30S ribosomal protein S20 [Candidatus Woesebacteria bacterium GW2011_GWC2_40_30]
MPVTKTAKRALRGSKNKTQVNKILVKKLEIAIRVEKVLTAVSLADRAAKKRIIHRNKAARIKSQLSRLVSVKTAPKSAKSPSKKASAKKK